MELDAVIVVVCNFSVFYRYNTVTKKNTMETLIKSDIRVVAIDETPWRAFEHIERLEHICQIVLASGVYK